MAKNKLAKGLIPRTDCVAAMSKHINWGMVPIKMAYFFLATGILYDLHTNIIIGGLFTNMILEILNNIHLLCAFIS